MAADRIRRLNCLGRADEAEDLFVSVVGIKMGEDWCIVGYLGFVLGREFDRLNT